MFRLEETEIAKAVENARRLHPTVRVLSFGRYVVSGSKGSAYVVRCYRDELGKVIDCECPTRDGVACKHGIAAVGLHIYLATTPLAHSH